MSDNCLSTCFSSKLSTIEFWKIPYLTCVTSFVSNVIVYRYLLGNETYARAKGGLSRFDQFSNESQRTSILELFQIFELKKLNVSSIEVITRRVSHFYHPLSFSCAVLWTGDRGMDQYPPSRRSSQKYSLSKFFDMHTGAHICR